MAIRLSDKYPPGRINAPDANYPDGSVKNETTPGVSNDGTPLDELWGNDIEGFKQWLFSQASVTPSDTPDTALDSDIAESLGRLGTFKYNGGFVYPVDSYSAGSDGHKYKALIENGPGTVAGVIDPVGDVTGTWSRRSAIDDYSVILAYGTYTSGTYTLPNSTTWSDYRAISVVQRVSSTDIFAQAMITEEILALGSFVVKPDVDQTESADITRSSSTQFTVSRSGNDSIAQVIGWLK